MRSDRFLSAAAVAAITLFATVAIGIFDAREQSGTIYPVYSSLRSDAAGTKAYYESIRRLEGMQVSRGFEPLEASRRSGATIFVLGVSPQMLIAAAPKYYKVAEDGNRLIIGLPICTVDTQADPSAKQQRPSRVWDVSWECVKRTPQDNLRSYAPDYYTLAHVGRQWRILASDGGGVPLAAERVVGNGSLVLASDTYSLTNEALMRHRKTDLLAQLLGQNKRFLFDEHHLGVAESRGVVTLARQYRLHGFAGGLLLIAVLFIWRNAGSFLPRIPEQTADEVSGRAASTGLTNLLGRAISNSELLKICVAEWKRSIGRRASEEQVLHVMEIATSTRAGKDPAASYREIAHLLSERRRR